MYYTLDRIEDNGFAVLIDDSGTVYNEKLSRLPEDPKAGNVYTLSADIFILDEAETETRRQRISEKKNRFFDKLKKK